MSEYLEKYATKSNTASAALLACVLPVLYWIVKRMLGIVIAVFGFLPDIITDLLGFVSSMLGIAMMLIDVLVIAILVYRMVKHDENNYTVYAAIAAAAFSLFAIMGIRGGNEAGWLGLISLLIGVDLAVKVVVLDIGLNGTIDPKQDVECLQTLYKNYQKVRTSKPDTKENEYVNPNIPHYENTPEIEPGSSYFDGTGLQLLLHYLLLIIVSIFTLTLLSPWPLAKIVRWRVKHTVIDGRRMIFDGTALQLFGLWIKWLLLTLITCGIYSYFAYVDYNKWETKHTFYEDAYDPSTPEFGISYFDGNSFEYLGYGILASILEGATCGLAYPWCEAMIQGWFAKHTVICGDRMFFDGTGLQLLGKYLLMILLTVVTFGLYLPWGYCMINRWIILHTHVDARWVG